MEAVAIGLVLSMFSTIDDPRASNARHRPVGGTGQDLPGQADCHRRQSPAAELRARLEEDGPANGHRVLRDALNTQKTIARQVIDGGGDYVMALQLNWLTAEQRTEWAGLKFVVVVESTRKLLAVSLLMPPAMGTSSIRQGLNLGDRSFFVSPRTAITFSIPLLEIIWQQ